MNALKAHVRNGRIIVDEPIDLPEGAELHLYLYDVAADSMPDKERAALERALERSLAQADAGELIEADEVLAAPSATSLIPTGACTRKHAPASGWSVKRDRHTVDRSGP